MLLTHGSLFAGIGGFDLGFERAGMETAWQVEIDKNCNAILQKHWPNVQRYEDVREVGRYNLEPVDVISGGFPCQDLSVAGRREGLAGERSGLWFEFARIVEEMEARWVVVENVPGLLSSNGGGDFAEIVRTLEQFGYCVAWRVLDSQYFGVPQRRRRVFIVGSLGNGSAADVLFGEKGFETLEQAGSPRSYHLSLQTRTGRRMSMDGSLTLIQDEFGLRVSMPSECERLQGFPDGWTEGLSDTQRYKTLGNAVTVNVAEWIGKRIVKCRG